MPKEVMDRSASDNEYLHPDFHGALSAGLIYLSDNFGENSVKEYVARFARKYHKKLISKIKQNGLIELQKHYEELYKIEKGNVSFENTDNGILMKVPECPAVKHMREKDYPVSGCWIETERSLNATICEEAGYKYELIEYNPETGASIQRFYK